ncbi:hypothetical protein YO5_17890 [Stutzerimonas stutzeri TS44]|nr:hypothetical protein YO5_17890 [Stutzerimonas stutzeri TS44]
MKASQIRALANIADKPGASVSTQLIAMRRVCRLFCHERATIHQERRALRRKAAKLRAFLPFTAAAAADLEQQAREHEAESLEGMSRALIGIGRAVILQSASTTAALGFDRLCDLLSVNPAHRAQAIRDGDTNVTALVFIACLEDSATGHGAAWGNGGPLYQACLLATADFIRTAPEDALPDPFAPGAPFGPKIPPVLRVV